MNTERLQKVLAGAGVASRRDCEELIVAGRVTVNGEVVSELGTRVDMERDIVAVDGTPIHQPSERTYILLHKPVGVVSTADDPQGRPTVVELVDVPVRVFPVGRLDLDSEGLLLLTDDGELMHRLTHPRFAVEKEYRVLLDQTPVAAALQAWRDGVDLDGEYTAPAQVNILEETAEGTWVQVILHEGRKRQIREVARQLGYNVNRLIRVREDQLQLEDLAPGQWRMLRPEEVQSLRTHLAAEPPRPRSERSRVAGDQYDERTPSREGRTRTGERANDARTAGQYQRDSRRLQGESSSWSRSSERSGDGRRSESARRDDRSGTRSGYQRERPRDTEYTNRNEPRSSSTSTPTESDGNRRTRPDRAAPRTKPAPDRAWRERQDQEKQARQNRLDWRSARTRRNSNTGSGSSSGRSGFGGRYPVARRPRKQWDEYDNEA